MKLVLWTIGAVYGSISVLFLLVLYRVHHPKRTCVQQDAERIAASAYHGPLREVILPQAQSEEQKKIIAWAWDYVKQTEKQ